MAKTITERVHSELRENILAGRHKPGERLKFADLQERYSASISVIREALTKLAEQDLVISEPQVGFQVVTLSRDDLSDLTEARALIEPMVFDWAVKEGDVAWESRVMASHHLLARTPTYDSEEPFALTGEWREAHVAFHRALLQGCPNRRLRSVADSLRDAAELYVAWSQIGPQAVERDVEAEHQKLLDTVLSRSLSVATEVLESHIRRTSDSLLKSDELSD